MKRFYMITLRWVTVDPPKIDMVLQPFGDWLRFSGYVWFVAVPNESPITGLQISDAVRRVLPTDADSVFVVRVDPSDLGGWCPPMTWDWFKRNLIGPNLPAPSLGGLLGGPTGGHS